MTLNEHIRRMRWQSVSVCFLWDIYRKVFSLSEELQIVVVCLEVKLFEIFIIINQMSQFASIPVTFSHWIFINY